MKVNIAVMLPVMNCHAFWGLGCFGLLFIVLGLGFGEW